MTENSEMRSKGFSGSNGSSSGSAGAGSGSGSGSGVWSVRMRVCPENGQLRLESLARSRRPSGSGCGTPKTVRAPSVSAIRRMGKSQSLLHTALTFQYRPSRSA